MNPEKEKGHRPLMVKKYYSMLLGGTLTMMVASVLLMSDSIIAGTFVGSDAVAGVTLVTPLYSVAAFFGSVFSLGVPICYSTDMGKFDKKHADKIFGTGLLMSVVVGAVLFIVILVFGDSILKSFHSSPQALEQARGYLFWMRFTILLLPLDMLMSEMVYNDGDETISITASVVQGAGNLCMSLLLSRTMGVKGIALASFLFTFASLATLFTHFLKKSNSLKLNFSFSKKILFNVARYSIIDASTYLFLGAGNAVLNRFVCTRFGADYLILVSVITLCREFQLIFDGVGEAITPIISIYIGEDCYPGVRNIYKRARKTAVAEGLIIILLMLLAAPLVPSLLGISDPELVRLAVNGLRIVSLGSVFVSLLYLSTSYYLILDMIPLGLAISALRDIVMAAIFVLPLGAVFGVFGMYAGFALSAFAAWLVSAAFLRARYGKDAPLLLQQRAQGKEGLLYSFDVNTNSILQTRALIEDALYERNYDEKTVTHVMLIFEELFMLIYEKNENADIQAECAILLQDDKIRIITRDTGIKFDLSDSDMPVESLRTYVISTLTTQTVSNKHHLVTMSFNRNMFELKGSKVSELQTVKES